MTSEGVIKMHAQSLRLRASVVRRSQLAKSSIMPSLRLRASAPTTSTPAHAGADADDDDELCCICLSELDGDDVFRSTCCGQAFHVSCLAAHKRHDGPEDAGLFSKSLAKCPLCRSEAETGLTFPLQGIEPLTSRKLCSLLLCLPHAVFSH